MHEVCLKVRFFLPLSEVGESRLGGLDGGGWVRARGSGVVVGGEEAVQNIYYWSMKQPVFFFYIRKIKKRIFTLWIIDKNAKKITTYRK